MNELNDWQVLIIGGCSGVGKSHLARQLAEKYKVPLLEMDDIRIALQQLVDCEQYPALFSLYDDSEYRSKLNEKEFVHKQLAVAEVVWKALEVLLSKHIRLNERVIIEGDCIIPNALVSRDLGGIETLFIYDDLDMIKSRQKLRNRPGNPVEHEEIDALFSYTHGEALREQATTNKFNTVKASPIDSLFDRSVELIS
jgi:2-phosphoglycerate kinase